MNEFEVVIRLRVVTLASTDPADILRVAGSSAKSLASILSDGYLDGGLSLRRTDVAADVTEVSVLQTPT